MVRPFRLIFENTVHSEVCYQTLQTVYSTWFYFFLENKHTYKKKAVKHTKIITSGKGHSAASFKTLIWSSYHIYIGVTQYLASPDNHIYIHNIQHQNLEGTQKKGPVCVCVCVLSLIHI